MTSIGIAAHSTEGNAIFGIIGGGHSAVYGPDGRPMSKPLPPDQEGFIYVELPMDMLVTVRHFSDPVGHYSRPDLLWLGIDSREKKHVRSEGADRKYVVNGVKSMNGVDEWQNGKV
jgi:nitrilase